MKNSQELLISTSPSPYDLLFEKAEFRPLSEGEIKIVPLYCSGCRRLFAPAEVYELRRGIAKAVHCWCGVEDEPVAKQDAKHSLAVQAARSSQNNQRARAIAAASQPLPGGRKKSVAAILAITTGFAGGHKFYLGEPMTGFMFLFFFWTLIPLVVSLYDAISLLSMSITTFNMTYNIDVILQLIDPPDDTVVVTASDALDQ